MAVLYIPALVALEEYTMASVLLNVNGFLCPLLVTFYSLALCTFRNGTYLTCKQLSSAGGGKKGRYEIYFVFIYSVLFAIVNNQMEINDCTADKYCPLVWSPFYGVLHYLHVRLFLQPITSIDTLCTFNSIFSMLGLMCSVLTWRGPLL